MGSRSHVIVSAFMMLLAVQSVAGCTSKTSPGQAGEANGPAVKAAPATLEQLAARTGCELQSQTSATELRQGSCRSAQGRYVMLTFVTDKAKQTWLSAAKEWGGTYLIGPRWVIVGTSQNLGPFRARVGGEIQAGDDHSGSGHEGHTPAAP